MSRGKAITLGLLLLAATRAWTQTCPPADPCSARSFVKFVPPQTTLSAAFYFPWHSGSGECPAPGVWCGCFSQAKPGNPRPVLGFYDSGNAAVVDAHMQQMVDHGIQVVGIEWFGFDNFNGNNFVNVVVPSVASHGLKFVLVYDAAIRLTDAGVGEINLNDPLVRQRFIDDFARFAIESHYYAHPNYLKFGNKPVVYVYVTRAIRGSDQNIRSAFDQARAAARTSGFDDLYIVADHLYWNPDDKANYSKLRLMGASAATAFGPVEPNRIPTTGRPIREWATKISKELYEDALRRLPNVSDVDIMPGIFPEYDDNGFGPVGPD